MLLFAYPVWRISSIYWFNTWSFYIFFRYPQIISSYSATGIGCMQLSVADHCLLQMMRCETTCFNYLALVSFPGGKRNIRFVSYKKPWILYCLEVEAVPLKEHKKLAHNFRHCTTKTFSVSFALFYLSLSNFQCEWPMQANAGQTNFLEAWPYSSFAASLFNCYSGDESKCKICTNSIFLWWLIMHENSWTVQSLLLPSCVVGIWRWKLACTYDNWWWYWKAAAVDLLYKKIFQVDGTWISL